MKTQDEKQVGKKAGCVWLAEKVEQLASIICQLPSLAVARCCIHRKVPNQNPPHFCCNAIYGSRSSRKDGKRVASRLHRSIVTLSCLCCGGELALCESYLEKRPTYSKSTFWMFGLDAPKSSLILEKHICGRVAVGRGLGAIHSRRLLWQSYGIPRPVAVSHKEPSSCAWLDLRSCRLSPPDSGSSTSANWRKKVPSELNCRQTNTQKVSGSRSL